MARVLIAGEEWGRGRDAFLALGHDAWSCDLKPTRVPGPHLQCDVREVIGQQWDILIAHPVCKYLTNAGARWLYERGTRTRIEARWAQLQPAADHYNMYVDANHIPMRCIENPIMHEHARALIHQAGVLQYVQPWMFGDPYTKATGLRLIGLPKLVATHKKSDYTEIFAECHKMAPGPERESLRSSSYYGIMGAMAVQWGGKACRRDCPGIEEHSPCYNCENYIRR